MSFYIIRYRQAAIIVQSVDSVCQPITCFVSLSSTSDERHDSSLAVVFYRYNWASEYQGCADGCWVGKALGEWAVVATKVLNFFPKVLKSNPR